MRAALAVAFLFMAQGVLADDTGVWFEADAEKQLGRQWSIGANAVWKSSEKVSIGIDATYKLLKWLKVQAGYDLQDVRYDGRLSSSGKYYNSVAWHIRHRISASATGQLAMGRWKLSLRERWTYTYAPSFTCDRTNVNEGSDAYGTVWTFSRPCKAKNTLRSRLSAQYSIRHSILAPYASVELFNAWQLEKVRYSVGTELKFSQQHSLKLYYLYQSVTDDDDTDRHVLGAGYKFSF